MKTLFLLLKKDAAEQKLHLLSWLGAALLGLTLFSFRDSITINEIAHPALSDLSPLSFFILFLFIDLSPLFFLHRAISADPPTPSDVFWKTRPISGKILFAEKTLFLLPFIGVAYYFSFFMLPVIWKLKPPLSAFFIVIAIAFSLMTSAIFPRRLCIPLLTLWMGGLLYFTAEFEAYERVEILSPEFLRFSALPTLISLAFPLFAFLAIPAHQYITRHAKRTWKLFAGSFFVSAALLTLLPMEYLELEPSFQTKITDVRTEKSTSLYQDGSFPSQTADAYSLHFSTPDLPAGVFWNPYATRVLNKTARIADYGLYTKRSNPWFLQKYEIATEGSGETLLGFEIKISGALPSLNKDLKNPEWVSESKLFPGFSNRTDINLATRALILPKGSMMTDVKQVKMILEESTITRLGESALTGIMHISCDSAGSVRFSSRPLSLDFDGSPHSYLPVLAHDFKGTLLVVALSPSRNKAMPLLVVPQGRQGYLYRVFSQHGFPDTEWQKDGKWREGVRIVVYGIVKTGRRALATVDLK
jgi:hypothetical protein